MKVNVCKYLSWLTVRFYPWFKEQFCDKICGHAVGLYLSRTLSAPVSFHNEVLDIIHCKELQPE